MVLRKPKSSNRSASSSTSTFKLLISNPGVCSRSDGEWRQRETNESSKEWHIRCRSRPGVHTRMFIRTMCDCSASKSFPPITRPALRPWCLPTARSTSKICSASSRVGEMMSAPRPSMGDQRLRYRLSNSGITKASVFPEPVRAAPSTCVELNPRSSATPSTAWRHKSGPVNTSARAKTKKIRTSLPASA